MDLIERLFHISPDGGNGVTEAGLFLALAACAVALCRQAFIRRRRVDAGP